MSTLKALEPIEMKTPFAPSWRLLLVLLALRAAPAPAHGGLPETSTVTVRRGNLDDLIVGATFGAVISRDRGQTWQWICPEGMGIGAWRPERYHWLSNGTIIGATGNALVRSMDGGCSWTSHPFFFEMWPTGLAVHPTDERLMFAATGRHTFANGIFRSEDGGETWTAALPAAPNVRFSAIRVAPSDARRIYASGQEGEALFISRSDDGGETWTRLAQPLTEYQRPYDLTLLAVSPASPEVLWVRVSAQGFSYLLKSTDGGATLTQVMELADVLIGVETSADGRTVWAATPVHLYRIREGTPPPYEPLPLPNGNACASRVGDTLYGCGSSWVHNWALARSVDEGTTWEPLFGLSGIQGALSCPAGTGVHETCPSRWPQLAQILGADGGVPPPPDAGTEEPPPPPPKDGCSATAGLTPAALLLLTLTLGRHSRRRPTRRP
jgi:photosystem II stability/assembly factor-like uncharacterized protein